MDVGQSNHHHHDQHDDDSNALKHPLSANTPASDLFSRPVSRPIGFERQLAPPSTSAQAPIQTDLDLLSHSDTETTMITSTPKRSFRQRTRSDSPQRPSHHSHSKKRSSIMLRFEHPEFLVSDSFLKSSGTPRHVNAQMPYKKSLTTKSKSSKVSSSNAKSKTKS